MSSAPVRTFVTIVMNLLVVAAVLTTVRIFVRYFGVLESSGPGEAIVVASNPFVASVGFQDVRSPYAGVFDVNATVSIVGILLVEWLLSVVRTRI